MTTDLREVSSNGSRTLSTGDLMLEPVKRRFRLPEVAVGLVVLLACALGVVLWQLNATRKDPVLAVANEVARGDVIEAGDLTVVYVSSDDPIAHLGRDQASRVVGRTALTDLEQGALLTSRAVSDGPIVQAGEGIVGLSLEPGQVPSSRLRAGDLVNVIAGAPPAVGGSTAEVEDTLLVEKAEVFAIEELPASGRLFVSLKMREPDANRVAAAAERGPVRLVMVGP